MTKTRKHVDENVKLYRICITVFSLVAFSSSQFCNLAFSSSKFCNFAFSSSQVCNFALSSAQFHRPTVVISRFCRPAVVISCFCVSDCSIHRQWPLRSSVIAYTLTSQSHKLRITDQTHLRRQLTRWFYPSCWIPHSRGQDCKMKRKFLNPAQQIEPVFTSVRYTSKYLRKKICKIKSKH